MQRLNLKTVGITFLPLISIILLFIFIPQPKSEDVIKFLHQVYARYGYLIVFLGAFIESIFLINIYLPGSSAVLLAAILARQGVLSLPLIILIGTLGVVLAYSVDFVLGKYGWYKIFIKFGLKKSLENTKRRMHKKRKWIVFVSCVHPNYGALSAVAAGLLNYEFQEFLLWFSIFQLFWSSFWGILTYLFGATLIDFLIKYFSLFLLTLVIIWTIRRLYSLKKEGYSGVG